MIIKSLKKQHLFKIDFCCFTVTLGQFNAFLLNKSINLFKIYRYATLHNKHVSGLRIPHASDVVITVCFTFIYCVLLSGMHILCDCD